jgi:(2R)-sulfolactate sulfo-lyase subunit beta
MSIISKDTTFLGYRRENGRVGVRNHVIILPLDDLSNAAAEAVAHNIKGAMAIPHPYGRLQFGADLDLHFRTLIGTGCNPNVAAVVVIGIEDGWTKKVVDGIAATGKPVVGFGIEGHGDHETIMKASARPRASTCSGPPRSSARSAPSPTCGCPPSAASPTPPAAAAPTPPWATPSTSCTALGNTLVLRRDDRADRRRTHRGRALRQRREVREKFMFMFDRYQDMINRHKTDRPVGLAADQGQHRRRPDHHRGKGAGQHPEDRQEVHGRRRARQGRDADAPGPVVHGLVLAAAEMVTLCAASGYAVHFFPTGQGNVIGNPILPVIKICANPRTVRTDERAHRRRRARRCCSARSPRPGRRQAARVHAAHGQRPLTAAEALGHREFVLTRLYESA